MQVYIRYIRYASSLKVLNTQPEKSSKHLHVGDSPKLQPFTLKQDIC